LGGSGLYPKGGGKNPPRIQDKPDRRSFALLAVSWIGHGRGEGLHGEFLKFKLWTHEHTNLGVRVCRERERARARKREKKRMHICMSGLHTCPTLYGRDMHTE